MKRRTMELTQLFYHLCLLEDCNPHAVDLLPKPEDLFLQIAWQEWSEQDWIALVCHPDFIRQQENERFLEELCQLLEQENLYNLEGISQDLYFALCISYHVWEENDSMSDQATDSALERLIDLLHQHPKHTEYVKDLHIWEDIKRDRRLVHFCQQAVSLANRRWIKPEEKKAFLAEAEELFLQSTMPREAFILRNLGKLPGTLSSWLLSFSLSKRKKKNQSFQDLGRECFTVFSDMLLDVTKEGHSPYQAGYIPLKRRLKQFQKRYGIRAKHSAKDRTTKKKSPIYSLAFVKLLKDKMVLPAYSTVYPYVPYLVWRALCHWFDGSTPLEQDVRDWLKTAAYFPAYERRWQREMVWREQQIGEAYLNEVFPLPDLNQGKRELLEEVYQGTAVEAREVQMIFHNVSLDLKTADQFLTHLTNAMIRFRFFLVTQSHEKDPVPEDAICFLKKEVLLYRKKEHRTCRMSHPAFLDMLSRTVDLLDQKENGLGAGDRTSQEKKIRYTETFLETVCKNLYLYEYSMEARK